MFNLNKMILQDLSNRQLYNNFILGTKFGVCAFGFALLFHVGGVLSTAYFIKSLGDEQLRRMADKNKK